MNSPADSQRREPAEQTPSAGQYVVVARRYRPQSFTQLIGQKQVSQALKNAIETNRVGHAYLFTGARGVGKTSTARIFAKSLNCQLGPTPEPCNECDICRSISSGEDVDVLEIDGASNRGIDEIRQLRSNVNVRPSRCRYKVYIIDEVHMLTAPAFNALLKTLEEPPEHVKFIFCTTDPEKIPITVLSRCQRFDFPPVETAAIQERLRIIAESEGVEADEAALALLARRAGGSMRDSQSLLEQLLSFCGERVRVDDVHAMLGTARSNQLASLCERLIARDTAGALQDLDAAAAEGVDFGQLAEQLLGYFRDMMAAAVGCDADMMLHTTAADFPQVKEVAQRMGLQTTLAAVQILDGAVTRLRQSTHTRTLLELAIVRICSLEQLDELSQVVKQLRDGSSASAAPRRPQPATARSTPPPKAPERAQKKTTAVSDNAAADEPVAERSESPPESQNAADLWRRAVGHLEGLVRDAAEHADELAIFAPNRLVARYRPDYTFHKERCERPEIKAEIERALASEAGRTIRLDLELLAGGRFRKEREGPRLSRRQRMKEKEKHPWVRQAMELFDAEMIRLDEPRRS